MSHLNCCKQLWQTGITIKQAVREKKPISNKILRRYKPFAFKEVSCFTVNANKSFSFIFCHRVFLKPCILGGVSFALQTHR